MKTSLTLISSAIAGVLALGFLPAGAAEKVAMEKCAGIVKAGMNDCGTAVSACAGTAKMDGEKETWIMVPKGTCEKIVGARLQTSPYARKGGK